jgi:outer membrane protein, multidrug efflux system
MTCPFLRVEGGRGIAIFELNEAQTRASLFASTVNVYKAMGGGWVTEAEALTR